MAAGPGERPIAVVSNRLPVTFQRTPNGIARKRSLGGLVSALDPVLRRRGGTWLGWPGIDLSQEELGSQEGEPYSLRLVPLSADDVASYYHGFSNRTLWPLFHSLPGRSSFDRHDWDTYEKVNQRFAQVTADAVGSYELAWVHDYHLMRVPLYLREHVQEPRIAFFLHIPFPPYDIFRLLPWDREILRGLLACDLVGFHVEGYARNFLDTVERLLGARVDRRRGLIEHGHRTVRVGAFPIGIDFRRYEQLALDAPPRDAKDGERIVLGADRLDYTKGIPERLLAFERLLDMHPEHREKVVLLQLAVPSRSQVQEYRDLKREIDELVGRINGRFATATWSPIRYLYQAFPPDRLAALYRDADVALLTPLRDGMNLVAKEFAAAQVGRAGVLVLSRLAGAAETMQEAIQVNPYDVDGTAAALHRALTMDEGGRRLRMTALRKRERQYDVYRWVREFLAAVTVVYGEFKPPSDHELASWLEDYLDDNQIALFLDYDGTLTPLRNRPEEAKVEPDMLRVLEVCCERPDMQVTVVSGRSLTDLRRMVSLPGLALAGTHGMEIDAPGLPSFRHPDLAFYSQKADGLAEDLAKITRDGAWTERKGATLTFHFRGVPPAEHEALMESARRVIHHAGFHAREAHCAMEAVPPVAWDKGYAVLHLLRERYGPDWPENVRAIYVGDDRTDEDAFRALNGLAHTFRVGPADSSTAATRRLPNVDSVRALLDWLRRRPIASGG